MKKIFLTIIIFVSIYPLFGKDNEAENVTAKYEVNTEDSEVKWTAYHLAKSYEHWGNVEIKTGDLNINGTEITSGSIVINMKSISNGDLTDSDKNKKLVNHLKSDEFFSVKDFPIATITIKGSTLSESGGSILTADLTIRGITKEVKIDAVLDRNTDSQLIYIAEFMVNRVDFKVLYGWSLENVMISGEFKLETKIVVDK